MAATGGNKKRAAAVARTHARSDTPKEPRKKSVGASRPVPIKGRPKEPEWRLQMQPELVDQAPDPTLWLAKPAKPARTAKPAKPASPKPEKKLGSPVAATSPVGEAKPDVQLGDSFEASLAHSGGSDRPQSDCWNRTEVEEQPFAEEFGIHPRQWSLKLRMSLSLMFLVVVGCAVGIFVILPKF